MERNKQKRWKKHRFNLTWKHSAVHLVLFEHEQRPLRPAQSLCVDVLGEVLGGAAGAVLGHQAGLAHAVDGGQVGHGGDLVGAVGVRRADDAHAGKLHVAVIVFVVGVVGGKLDSLEYCMHKYQCLLMKIRTITCCPMSSCWSSPSPSCLVVKTLTPLANGRGGNDLS